MIRHIRPIAFVLAIAAAAPGCREAGITGNPSNNLDSRTLASMLPFITKSLTPLIAEQRFGVPDARQTTGTVVLIYDVEDRKQVSLGFPALDGTILYAKLTSPGGTVTSLPIGD